MLISAQLNFFSVEYFSPALRLKIAKSTGAHFYEGSNSLAGTASLVGQIFAFPVDVI